MFENKDFMDMDKNDNFILKMLALLLVILIFGGWLLTSCSVAKKVEKAYEKAAAYSPLSTKDSTNARKIALKVIKAPAPITKPGKIVRVPFEKKVLDSNKLRKAIDSLNEAHDYDMEDLSLDCIKSVKEAQKYALKEGFEDGYAKGQLEYFLNHEETKLPDTVFIPDTSLIFQLDNCEVFLREAQAENIKTTAQRDIYKKQSTNKNWWIIVLSIGIGALGFFKVKSLLKPKLPIV